MWAASDDRTSTGSIELYNCINSDCSTRLRLALAWKELAYTHIDCGSPFQHADRPQDYAALNPTGAVPTLRCCRVGDSGEAHVITQSMAALEYLDEAYPSRPRLLPQSVIDRARSRTLAAILASDTHPLTAPRVTRQLQSQYVDSPEIQREEITGFISWRRHWIHGGLKAYEDRLAAEPSATGLYSVRDEVSLADLCLLPQVWRSVDYGINLDEFPTIKRIVVNLEKHEVLRSEHWNKLQ